MIAFAALDPLLSRVPDRWRTVEFRRVFTLVESFRGTDVSSTILSLSSAGSVEARQGEGRQPPSIDYLERYNRVGPGQLVVNPLWLVGGAIGVSGVSGCVSPEYRVYEPASCVHPRYAHHLLRSQPYRDQYHLLVRAETTFDRRISKNDFHPLPIILPPAEMQRAIADFLDTETARIDALITKKRQAALVLRERFQATCDAACSSPARVPLRRVLRRLVDGTHGTFERLDTGLPLLSAKNLRHGVVHTTMDESMISEADYRDITRSRRFSPGDTLLGVIGGSIGNVARLRSGDPLAFQRSVASLSPGPIYDGDFLYFVCRSRRFREQLLISSNTSAQAGVYLGDLASVLVPLPALQEQQFAAMRLQQLHDNTERTCRAIEGSVLLLQERRQALITAAVTGERAIPGAAA